jgi:hypothetical protein
MKQFVYVRGYNNDTYFLSKIFSTEEEICPTLRKYKIDGANKEIDLPTGPLSGVQLAEWVAMLKDEGCAVQSLVVRFTNNVRVDLDLRLSPQA